MTELPWNWFMLQPLVPTTITVTPFVAETPADSLSIEQKQVILEARGGSLATELLAHLHEMSAPSPSPRDYVEMIKRRSICKRGDYYVVTPGGLRDAQTIIRDLCRSIGVHQFADPGPGTRYTASDRCSCGWSAGYSLNAGHVDSQRAAARSWHLRHVGAVV